MHVELYSLISDHILAHSIVLDLPSRWVELVTVALVWSIIKRLR